MPVLEVQPRTTVATPATTTAASAGGQPPSTRAARLAQYEREAPVTTRSGTTRRAMDPMDSFPRPPTGGVGIPVEWGIQQIEGVD